MPIKNRADFGSKSSKKFGKKLSFFKGTRKVFSKDGDSAVFGLNLGRLLRLEVNDPQARRIIIRACSSEDQQQEYRQEVAQILAAKKKRLVEPNDPETIYLESIPVVFAHKTLEKSCDSCYTTNFDKHETLSGVKLRCDREKIYMRISPCTDINGNVRSHRQEVDEVCPMAGRLGDCPNGCKVYTELNFYLYPLIEYGIHDIARLTTRSETDVEEIYAAVESSREILGDPVSAIGSEKTAHRVLYNLARREVDIQKPVFRNGARTGKTTDDKTFALQLRIDSDWLEYRQNYLRIHEVRSLGGSLTPKMISAAVGLDYVDVDSRVVENDSLQLPPSEWKISPEGIKEIKELCQANGMGGRETLSFLQAFGLQESDLETFWKNLSRSDFDQIKASLSTERSLK